MEVSLSDAAAEMFKQAQSGPDFPEEEKPFSVATKAVWDAVEKKDMPAFREALRDAITIAVNER